jgi:beta-ureidopropionase / N-carbamoyl-L-amino-acid hydrolase
MPQIKSGRLLTDLRRLAEFGAYKSGVHRPTFSHEDIEARRWLAGRFTDAGLEASIDGIGNVFGRSCASGPRLLIGSHSESQNHAGWLDGALGVIYGLEVARAFREDPRTAGSAIDVASWADEEGHFGSFLGSRSFIGDVTDEEIDKARDHNNGTPLHEALAAAGLAGRKRETIVASDTIGYLEAHIEQGDTLDEAGLRLGVVTGIVGIRQYRIVFVGEANHAGTTRMVKRKDAGVALVKLCAAIADRFPQVSGPRSVWTLGAIRLEPGQPSIVPGRAEMMFQVRDLEAVQLQRFEDVLLAFVTEANATGPCAVTMETVWTVSPVLMSQTFQDALSRAAQKHAPGKFIAMPSGAGHDAQILARKLPSAMLFVPSIKGVSHHWTEDTSEADIVLGCQTLADAAEEIALAARGFG